MNKEFLYLGKLCAIARGLPAFSEARQKNSLAAIAELLTPLDEDLLLRKAIQHKTVSALYRGLAGAETGLSKSGMKKLKQLMTFEQAARSFMLHEWQCIDAACKRHGVPVMTIKGPAVSLQLYGDALVREYTDLDMVVSMQDKYGMAPIMEEIGYTIHHPAPKRQTEGLSQPEAYKHLAKPPRLRHYSRFIQKPIPSDHLVFSQKTSPLHVEIHNEVFKDGRSNNGASLQQLFARSATVVQAGYGFTTLGLADHAVFMLLHGAKHNWCLLHWVLDAAAILHRYDHELHREMAARIRSLGKERHLALIVQIVQKLFPIDVPEPFRALISPYLKSVATPVRVAMNLMQQAKEGGALSKNTSLLRFRFCYKLPLEKGCQQKIKVLLPNLPNWRMNRTDAESLPLPKFLHPLYLLLRPFFILYHGINRALTGRKKTWLPQN